MAESAGLSVKIGADTSGLTKGAADVKKFGQVVGATAGAVAGDLNKASMAVDKFGKLASNGSKEAGYAFQSLGRVVSDLPFGPGGIANNLEVLPSAFRSLSAAAKESGQSIGSVLLKSLAGPGGLMLAFSGVSAALSIATFGLSAWTRLLGNGKKDVDEYKKALDGIEESAAKESLQLRTLTTFITDESNSRELRLQAVKKLRSEYGPYLKDLTNEQILSGQLGDALNQINAALLKKVALQAGEEKIIPLIKQQLDLQLKQRELQKTIDAGAGVTREEIDRAAASGIKTVGALKAGATGAKKEFDLNAKAIEELTKRIDNLFVGISSFINDSTKLELSKGIKEQGDEITKVVEKLKADRDALARNSLIPALDKPEEDIKLIEAAIKRLFELKVPPGSSIIDKLISMEDFDKLLAAEFKKNASKFGEEDIPVPIEISPAPIGPSKLGEFYKKVRKQIDENLKRAFIRSSGENTFNIIGEAVGLDSLNSEELDENFNRIKAKVESLQQFIVNELGGAFQSIFQTVLTDGGNAFEQFGNVIKKLVTQLIAAAAAAFLLSALFGGLGVAKVAGAATSFKGIFGSLTGIKLANGGIASGPTMAMVGEYAGAKSNPEVIAPLNKLKGLISDAGGGSQVFIPELRVEGQDLLVAFRRAEKVYVR